MNYISKEKGIELTPTKQVMRNPDLRKLNEQLHFKAIGVHNKSQQKVFSLISVFFYITKVSELAKVKKEKNKYRFLPDAEKMASLLRL